LAVEGVGVIYYEKQHELYKEETDVTETHIWMLCGGRAKAASVSTSRQNNSAFA